jgi:hypothetical protein
VCLPTPRRSRLCPPAPLAPVPACAARATRQLSDVSFASAVGRGFDPQMHKRIPYDFCSEVQAATLERALQGRDV